MAWGIRDSDHAVVGTSFDPWAAKKAGEELESWRLRLLEPHIGFRFFSLHAAPGPVIVMVIERASREPVRFGGQEYIRIGSYEK